MSVGCDEPSGSPMGKERQATRIDTPREEDSAEEKPDALIKRVVEAARRDFRRRTKIFP